MRGRRKDGKIGVRGRKVPKKEGEVEVVRKGQGMRKWEPPWGAWVTERSKSFKCSFSREAREDRKG